MHSISIAVPVFNEEKNVAELVRRIVATFRNEKRSKLAEILFVDDGSTDETFELLRNEATKETRIKIISFSRNFGHQIAASAALDYARGNAVVILDGDLQDPPELIPKLIEKWLEGYAIVYGVRKTRRDGVVKRGVASLFYRLLRRIADVDIPLDTGDFALLDRKVVDVIKRMPERSRYLRGLRAWSGFKSTSIEFERAARFAGESKYTLKKMIDLAASGIIGFSTVPLRIAAYVGLVMALVSVVGGCVVLFEWFSGSFSLVRGWASIMFAFFFVSGIQLFILGIMGEYIGRIYREVQARPLYVIREKVGL